MIELKNENQSLLNLKEQKSKTLKEIPSIRPSIRPSNLPTENI